MPCLTKKTSYLVLFMLVAITYAGCTGPFLPFNISDGIEPEEREIYSTVVKELILPIWGYKAVEIVVVQDYTVTHDIGHDLTEYLDSLAEDLPEITADTLEDFRTRNTKPYPIREEFDREPEYVFISEQERAELFKDIDGWSKFYERFPSAQGIAAFSKVGFNRERNQALVYVENLSNFLDAAGYFVFLTKKDGAWTIQDMAMVWIS